MNKILIVLLIVFGSLLVFGLLPAKPAQPQQEASASCVGLFVIGSCNVSEQTTLAQPPERNNDRANLSPWAALGMLAILFPIFLLLGWWLSRYDITQ